MHHRYGRKKSFRCPRLFRGFALILTVMLVFLLSGCYSGNNAFTDDHAASRYSLAVTPENKKYLRTDEWVRMLTLVLTYPEDRASLWASIPEAQRSEISYSDFVFYTTALSKGLRAPISSFSEVTGMEKENFLRRIRHTGAALEPKADRASFWWLHAKNDDGRMLRFAVAVTEDSSGIPRFSKSWIQSMRSMYDFVLLYADAIAQRSPAALAALIRQHAPIRSKTHLAAIDNRVKAILRYYGQNIDLKQENLTFRALLPGYAVIEEQRTPAAQENSHVRSVAFQSTDGVIRADEQIEEKLDADDMALFYKGRRLFALNDESPRILDADTLPVLGIPLNLEQIEDANGIMTRFRVTWPGITVEAAGTCHPESVTFDGIIRQIQYSYSDFRTGSFLKPGDSVDALLMRYPFAQENGYRIISEDNPLRQTFSVQIEAGFISQISLFREVLDKQQ